MSTSETFNEFNTTLSDKGKQQSYGSPTVTQADLMELLTQDENGTTFPEGYPSIFDTPTGYCQFGLGQNVVTPSASESLSGNTESLQINSTSHTLEEHFSNVRNLSNKISHFETTLQALSLSVERLVGRIDECQERVGETSNAVMRLEGIFQCVIRREEAAMSKFGDLASRYGT